SDADAVYRDVVAEQLLDRVAVGVRVGFTVVAVGDQENDFSAVAASVFEQLRRLIDRIIPGLGGPVAENDGGPGVRRGAGAGDRLSVDRRPAREYSASRRRGR